MNLIINFNNNLENIRQTLLGHKLSIELYKNHGLLCFVDQKEKEKNALISLHYQELLTQLREKLPQIKIIILKGLSLVSQLYENQPYRPFTDLDLLIFEKEDRNILDLYLLKNGFSKSTDELSPHKIVYNKMFDHSELVIEVHKELYPHRKWLPETLYLNDLKVYSLAPTDHALFLIFHLVYQHSFLKLMWLNDLYLLFEKYPLDVNQLYLKARDLGLGRSLQLFLAAMKNFYGKNYDRKISRLALLLVNTNFLLDPKKHFIRYLLVKTLSKQDLFSAFRYYFLWFNFFLKKKKFNR